MHQVERIKTHLTAGYSYLINTDGGKRKPISIYHLKIDGLVQIVIDDEYGTVDRKGCSRELFEPIVCCNPPAPCGHKYCPKIASTNSRHHGYCVDCYLDRF